MDTTRAKPPLGDLETAPLALQNVIRRHPHIFEQHLAVAVGGIVIAENVHHFLHRDARCVTGHDDHGLLAVTVGIVRVRLAYQDQHFTARESSLNLILKRFTFIMASILLQMIG